MSVQQAFQDGIVTNDIQRERNLPDCLVENFAARMGGEEDLSNQRAGTIGADNQICGECFAGLEKDGGLGLVDADDINAF